MDLIEVIIDGTPAPGRLSTVALVFEYLDHDLSGLLDTPEAASQITPALAKSYMMQLAEGVSGRGWEGLEELELHTRGNSRIPELPCRVTELSSYVCNVFSFRARLRGVDTLGYKRRPLYIFSRYLRWVAEEADFLAMFYSFAFNDCSFKGAWMRPAVLHLRLLCDIGLVLPVPSHL